MGGLVDFLGIYEACYTAKGKNLFTYFQVWKYAQHTVEFEALKATIILSVEKEGSDSRVL